MKVGRSRFKPAANILASAFPFQFWQLYFNFDRVTLILGRPTHIWHLSDAASATDTENVHPLELAAIVTSWEWDAFQGSCNKATRLRQGQDANMMHSCSISENGIATHAEMGLISKASEVL